MDILNMLYGNRIGRMLLKPLISKPVSDLSGFLLDTKASKALIAPFVKANAIDTDDYILDDIHSFNDFFCRKIKNGLRPVPEDAGKFIAPCDGLLSVYRIDDDTKLKVKQSVFSMRSLLRDKRLAREYTGGYALVFRLCVNHYHRYIYFDSGKRYKNRRIQGVYHTVRPVALDKTPVFTENAREYTVIDTDNFGRCVQMEVGAMLVGRIVNEHTKVMRVSRGEEKGHFEYGGSTVIVLVPKDKVTLRNDILSLIDTSKETPVIMGEILND